MLVMKEVLLPHYERETRSGFNLICSTGIDVVRNRIKGFAQKKVTLPPGRHKLVILDEADRYVLDNELYRLSWMLTHDAV